MSVGTFNLVPCFARCVHCGECETGLHPSLGAALELWTEMGWRVPIVDDHPRAACPKCVRRGA